MYQSSRPSISDQDIASLLAVIANRWPSEGHRIAVAAFKQRRQTCSVQVRGNFKGGDWSRKQAADRAAKRAARLAA